MVWHSFPHLPEEGAHILAKFKGSDLGNLFEMRIRQQEGLEHIEKWCYYDEYQEILKRKIRDREYN